MRAAILALPLVFIASSAIAQTPPEQIELPRELTDMRWADRMADAMVAMSGAFLNMPIGEIEAAIEGRQPSAADQRRTIRSETGISEREVRQQIDATRPAMQAGIKALAAALPAMMKGLDDAKREMERATANMPRPDYPKR